MKIKVSRLPRWIPGAVNNSDIRRQSRAALIGFAVTFMASWAYFSWAEADLPFQQYADPLLPCVYVGGLGGQAGVAIYMIGDIMVGLGRLLARRRRNR